MKLAVWLNENDVSDSSFAATIGVSRQALFRYRTGERTPRGEVMARIRAATDGMVTADDFMPEPIAPSNSEARA